jgi:2-keto-4-pentenoate hydratase/2-oxohepta-3-ene-1,7-dioic acid hydratase in catechol pathway
VKLLAPLPNPRLIYGVAHNYTDALAERGMAHPEEPVLFMKERSTVIGPEEPIILPAGIGGVTYEAEIAAVIGSRRHGLIEGPCYV